MIDFRNITAAVALLSSVPAPCAAREPLDSAAAGAGTSNGRIVAERLYAQALALMEAGNFEAACVSLERVVALVPRGVGGRLTLAECYESSEQPARAFQAYRAAEALAGDAGRSEEAAEARARASALDPQLAWLRVVVPARVRQTPGLEITCDGAPVDPAHWDEAIPIDPGVHLIVARTQKGSRWEYLLEAPARSPEAPLAVRIPEDVSLRSSAPAQVDIAVVNPWSKSPHARTPVKSASGYVVAGSVLGGLGATSIGVGAISGAIALSKYNSSNARGRCDEQGRCTAEGLELRAESIKAGDVATAAIIAGGAALGAGVALVLTAPRADAPQVVLSAGLRGLTARGSW